MLCPFTTPLRDSIQQNVVSFGVYLSKRSKKIDFKFLPISARNGDGHVTHSSGKAGLSPALGHLSWSVQLDMTRNTENTEYKLIYGLLRSMALGIGILWPILVGEKWQKR